MGLHMCHQHLDVQKSLNTGLCLNLGAQHFSDKDFQKYITEHCWDNLWNSSRLTDKQKSFNTLCILASTNKWPEFKLHLNGAFNNGCTLNELKELFKQISLYAGIPVGVECYKHTEELLLEKNIKIKNSILNKKID